MVQHTLSLLPIFERQNDSAWRDELLQSQVGALYHPAACAVAVLRGGAGRADAVLRIARLTWLEGSGGQGAEHGCQRHVLHRVTAWPQHCQSSQPL